MKSFCVVKVCLAVLALACVANVASADIMWQWSFGTEAGTFTTDGNLVQGQAPSYNYTIDVADFEVTASAVPSNIGATYVLNQPEIGFIWDGQQATQWWRSSGVYTNGTNIYTEDHQYRYLFYPGYNALFNDSTYQTVVTESSMTLQPVVVPEPATMLILGVGGLPLLRRLRKKSL